MSLALLFLAAPAQAVTVPHVFATGESLVSIADEGLDPDHYASKLNFVAPNVWAPIGKPGPCTWPERLHRSLWHRCGAPAQAVEDWPAPPRPVQWAGGGGGSDRPSPAPIPLPASGILLLFALGALAWRVRR